MKKSIITLFLLVFPMMLTAKEKQVQESPDTITSVKNVEKLTVIENRDGMKIIINGTTDNPRFRNITEEFYPEGTIINSRQTLGQQLHNLHNSDNTITALSPTIAFGFVIAPGDGDAAIEPSKSFEISIFEITGVNFNFPDKNTSVSIGLGMSWRNWRTTKDTRFFATTDRKITIGHYDGDITPRFSRIKQYSLSVPVMINRKLPVRIQNRKLSVRIGGVFNWNSHASMKTAWLDPEGHNNSESSDKIGQRRFSADIAAIVNVTPWFGIYCRYSPSPILKKEYGPQFRTFSTGISFTL